MGHHQSSAIEHVVADQTVEELGGANRELLRLAGELFERFGKAVRDSDVLAAQLSDELHVVVSGNCEGASARNHLLRYSEYARSVGPPVDKVSEKDHFPPGGVPICDRPLLPASLIAETRQKVLQLPAAAMDVPDDVEGAGVETAIVPERLPDDLDSLDVFRPVQNPDPPEALALKLSKRSTEVPDLPPHDVSAEVPIGSRAVPLDADRLREIQDDRDGEHVLASREIERRLSSLGLDVRGVEHRQPAGGEPPRGDEVENVEGVLRGPHVVLVVRDEPPAVV